MRQPRQLTLPQVLSQTSDIITLPVHGQQAFVDNNVIGRRSRRKEAMWFVVKV